MANKAVVKYSCANCGFIKAYWESRVGGGISKYMAKWLELFKVMVWKVDLEGEIYCVDWKEKNGVLGQERKPMFYATLRGFFLTAKAKSRRVAQHLMAQAQWYANNYLWQQYVIRSLSQLLLNRFYVADPFFSSNSFFSFSLLCCLVTQMETLEDCGRENENHTVAMNCSTVPLLRFPFFSSFW